MPVAIGCRRMAMSPFVMAGRYLAMVMWTGAEVEGAPRLSVATAVRVCEPTSSLALTLYGLVASLPSNTGPSKNWTLVMEPSESLAEARIVRAAEELKTAPSTGLVIVTLGGIFALPWTVTDPPKP